MSRNDDSISRQEAIEIIKNYCENGCDYAEDNWCPSCQREKFVELLKALPSAQPERKKGKWIRNDNGTWSCNKCSSWIPDEQHYYANYCLYCGADMRGEAE